MKRFVVILGVWISLMPLHGLQFLDDYEQGLEIATAYQMPILLVFSEPDERMIELSFPCVGVRAQSQELRSKYFLEDEPTLVLIDSMEKKIIGVSSIDEDCTVKLQNAYRDYSLRTFSRM
ncbi:MAG: hypothetical protein KAR79_01315 [Simkaniaceae bacterium]|nr:hypothetical protein [Simkaniaceae bacterium]